jgi:radical SAM superfamily enzyme YgiQ (UPF0313 family)
MRVLFLQLTGPGLPPGAVQYQGALGSVMASVRAAGHEIDLTGAGDPDPDFLRLRVNRSRAGIAVVWMRAVHAALARRVTAHLQREHQIPVVAAGPFATVSPAEALSLPGVTAVAVGEAERPLAAFLNAYAAGDDFAGIRGMWVNTEEGVARNEPAPPPADLDELPWPERRLFGYAEAVRLSGTAEFSVGRGCRQACGYCINERVGRLSRGAGISVRRRSVAGLLAEIRQVAADFPGIRRLSFPDCTLATDRAWLEEFAAAYPREFPLPFRCHVRANQIDEPTAALLKSAGCEAVEIEVVSGSDFVRNDVFRMETSDAQIAGAFAALRKVGVRTRTRLLVGSPYDSEITLDETVKLHREVRPDAAAALTYHPFPETAAAELARDQGWLSGRGEGEFFAGRSVLDMRSLSAADIERHRRDLPGRILEDSRSGLSSMIRIQRPEPGPQPIHFREDGTLFAPGEGPFLQPDGGEIAAQMASAWKAVRSGMLLNLVGLAAVLGGLALVTAGILISGRESVSPAAAWVPVILGFYGGLFGAVVWVVGHVQCCIAPTRMRGRLLPAAALGFSAAVALAALIAHRHRTLAGAWTAGELYVFLAVVHLLWAGRQTLYTAYLERIAVQFSAVELLETLGRRHWAAAGVALAGPVIGLLLFAGGPELGRGAGWVAAACGLAAAAELALHVRMSLRVSSLLAGDRSAASAEPAASSPAGPVRSPPAPRCSICGTLLPPARADHPRPRCPVCDSGVRLPADRLTNAER